MHTTLLAFMLDSTVSPWVYVGFIAVVLGLLALDLGVFHRKAHAPSMREAIGWTVLWVAVALVFGGVVIYLYEHQIMGLGSAVPVIGLPDQTVVVGGTEAGRTYLTAYILEKSLSMDNVFVIAMIFASLGIPAAYQHRVLFWGIMGALVLRGLMIVVGATLIATFAWTVYAFGVILIVSAIKMALSKDDVQDVESNWLVRLMSRVLPISKELDGQKLVSKVGGKWHGTPLLVALVVVEAADVMFAVDSIPAVFAITADPFIVFTSNIMAILGLRSLYFCLAAAMRHFKFLKTALIGVLLFVGVKMMLVHTPWKIDATIALSVVLGLLASGIAASVLVGRWAPAEPDEGLKEAEKLAPVFAPSDPIEKGITLPEDAPARWRIWLSIWRANRALRRTIIFTTGAVVILVGIIIQPLPGPGLSILGPLGLGIWASEFLWARRVLTYVGEHEKGIRGVVDKFFERISRLWIVPVVAWFWISAWLLSEYAPGPPWIVWTLAIPIFTPICYVLFRWYKVRRQRKLANVPSVSSSESSS